LHRGRNIVLVGGTGHARGAVHLDAVEVG
jgi:hypothetical protein